MAEQLEKSNRPAKWEERFLIKRFDDEPIEITLAQYNKLLEALVAGDRFVKVNKHILMVNALRSIDPKWGEKNIPPRPKESYEYQINKTTGGAIQVVANQKELDEWDGCFL